MQNLYGTLAVRPTLLTRRGADGGFGQRSEAEKITNPAVLAFALHDTRPVYWSLAHSLTGVQVADTEKVRERGFGHMATTRRIASDLGGAFATSSRDRIDRVAAIAMIRTSRGKGLTSSRVRRLLAGHPDAEVRQYLASRPSAPGMCEFQEILACDSDRSVRSALARCQGFVCATALTELALDEESGVRACVADREGLPALVWRLLARDPASSVRLRVAHNPHAPSDVLRILCSDESAQVRHVAQDHPYVPSDGRVEAALRVGQ